LARVLLTGARGFIGRHCRKRLLDDGWEVHAVATRPLEEDDPAAHDGSIWHVADLLDADAVRRLAAQVRPSHLLHLAWYTVPGDCYHSAENARLASAGRDLLAALA